MKSGEQSEKIIWFEKFFPELLKKPFKEGIKEARELRNKAREKRNPEDEGIALFAEGLLNRFSNRHTAALSLYNRAMKFFIQSESHEWIAALEHGIGHCYDLQGKPKEAEKFYLSSIEFYKENKISKREAMVYVNLGHLYSSQAENKNALYHYEKAYKILSKTGDIYTQAIVLNNIAGVYNSEKEFDKAIKFYKAGLKVFFNLKDNNKIIGNYTNIGVVYLTLGKIKSAEQNFLIAERYITQNSEKYLIAHLKIQLGKIYTGYKKYNLAEDYLFDALKLCGDINDNVMLSLNLMSLGNLCEQKKDIANAKYYFTKALNIMHKYNYRKLAIETDKKLSKIYEREKNLSAALKYFKSHHKFYAEVYNESAFKEISVLKSEIEKQKAENESELLRLKNIELNRDIEIKIKELNQAANYIVQKNNFVDSVISDIRNYLKSSEIPGLNKSGFLNYLGLLERKKRLNEDIIHFENNLNQMNIAFLDKLSRKYPQLTRIELKICSLMKINLSTKEIARLLSISHRTVETHRHNIIQKLKLKKSKALRNFINAL